MVIDAEDLPVPGGAVEAEAVDVEDDDDLANLLGGLAVDDSDKKPSLADTKPAVQEGTDSPVASSKIRMLLELLEKIRFRGERTIVFSQFTSFLDILGPFLVSKGIAFVRCKSRSSPHTLYPRCHAFLLSSLSLQA
jgi:SNF2 family DNA or RNA helicase